MSNWPVGDKLNIGSGQRRFEGNGWINIDAVSRPGQIPDLIIDVGKEALPYDDNSMEYVVLCHMYEHLGLGEGHGLIREAHRVLKSGGSLIIGVPDMKALAIRWLDGRLEDYLYFVNVYGAYQGEPGDRHAWGFHEPSLIADIRSAVPWSSAKALDGVSIPGADFPVDWWTLQVQFIK